MSEFDKGQIVMARRLGQSISKIASLVRCSRSAVVDIYQKWSKEGTVVNRRQGHGKPRLARVTRSRRWATVAHIAQEVNAGSDGKVSEYTVHHSLLPMGLHSHRPVRVPMLTPVHRLKRQQWAREHQNWTTEQWKKLVWSIMFSFTSLGWAGASVSFTWGTQGTRMHYGKKACRRRQCNVWALFCWETLGPVILVDVTLTHTTYLSIVADHVHPFMETVFAGGHGPFQQDNEPCHKSKMSSICGICWTNKSIPWRSHFATYKT